MLRLFAALAVPEEIAQALSARQHDLQGARWRPLEALHITLRFFGEIREDVADDLDGELSRIAGAPLSLELEGVGAFGEGRDVHAVWAGVAENAALRQLAGRCEAAARRAGLSPDRRTYRPHVTLAYLTRPDPADVAAWIQRHNLLKSPPFEVSRFGLYSSQLSPKGSSYRLEQDYPLR
ncbi:RNA 2',3'-cyclic phosphodiesterase [Phenylobacterium sp.]|uniref:RNA 2',3'-cyclic phosphodiesterase n=1 Tax=Phenylobacterium sp. TaxID=1871053 RepID=UPI0017E7D1A4|nr:RNA 2',3'-cyclic phosphodiesterase [Phenylobacterium sp.]MBA4795059.1 RNA 2',3'-cyclic phosphodiesterase [Phenylobacterium sp.]MBC7168275.1 RNA 2',3'-cyclic phosphodiesterase [Phenylobacterium sp.]